MKRVLSENPFVLSAVIIFGLAAIFGLSRVMEKNRPSLPDSYIDQDLALEGAKIKKYSMGLNGLIADWYWILTLQYVGNKVIGAAETNINLDDLRPLNPRLLYPYLDNSTTLDPRFIPAYAYGATVLPSIDPEQAVAICEKGIRNNPSEWILYHYLGFIHWKLGDYEKATAAYETGAELPEAANFMKMMSARMRTEGGSRATARALYLKMIDTGDESMDESIKAVARLRLLELDSLDDRDAIQKALLTFKEQNNRCATRWPEVFPLLLRAPLPSGRNFRVDGAQNLVDPTGAPYVLDAEKCVVAIDFEKSKLPPWEK